MGEEREMRGSGGEEEDEEREGGYARGNAEWSGIGRER